MLTLKRRLRTPRGGCGPFGAFSFGDGMAEKKSGASVPDSHPTLIVSRLDADAKISGIETGKELKSRTMESWEDLRRAQMDHSKWSDFNRELLKRLFSGDEYFVEYSSNYGMLYAGTADLERERKRIFA